MENCSTVSPTGRGSRFQHVIMKFDIQCILFLQITKKQVGNFTPSRIPCCQLTAKWIGQGRPSELSHKVTLTGAKEPFNFFNIVIDFDSSLPGN